MHFENIPGLKLTDEGMLDIPPNVKRIKFDIGLSWCAPNSAAWLQADTKKELFVIGVEPNRFACQRIGNKVVNPHHPYEQSVIDDNNYMLINCALYDVPELTMKPFYHIGVDPGTSSFLKPTSYLKDNSGLEVEEISDVPTIPFKFLLERVPWDRFEFIEHVKTDCQGVDLSVILSAGSYVDRIVFLDCEIDAKGVYENEPDVNQVFNKIQSLGFRCLTYGVNSSFVNVNLEHLVSTHNLDNYTTGS